MNLLPLEVTDYIRKLCDRYEHPILLEMEALAAKESFPIVGRMAGSCLELLARSVRARRVFELGSGFGFSAFWFSRAVGPAGEIFLTDGDPDNMALAQDFLSRAALWDPCRFITGDAVASLAQAEGEFDLIYCDIDKEGYPAAWAHAAERLRIGGMYVADNVLWSGRVADPKNQEPETVAIRAHNEAIFSDERFVPTIIPIRDGLVAATRIA